MYACAHARASLYSTRLCGYATGTLLKPSKWETRKLDIFNRRNSASKRYQTVNARGEKNSYSVVEQLKLVIGSDKIKNTNA